MDATTNQLHCTAATAKIKSTIQNMKTLNRRIAQIYAPESICSESFLEIIIKVSLAEFTFSNISCFQHILLNTFRRMRLNYVL